MIDFKLITKRQAGVTPSIAQNGNPAEYFGIASNDICLDKLNDIAQVTGTLKLQQDINKILLTTSGANTDFNLYGTTLRDLIGTPVDMPYIRAKVKDSVTTALKVLAYINRDNSNKDERPKTLYSLDINLISESEVQVGLVVITESDKSVATNLIVTV